MSKFNEMYVGLDVHKATIAVAIVRGAHSTAHFYGEIENPPQAIAQDVNAFSQESEVVHCQPTDSNALVEVLPLRQLSVVAGAACAD